MIENRITDIKNFIPKNLGGHCWHLTNPHMTLSDGISKFPDYTCCYCGVRSVAAIPFEKRPTDHGEFYPGALLKQEDYWEFTGNHYKCQKGITGACKGLVFYVPTPRPEPPKPEFYDSGGRNNPNLYPR
jgi:hypothetical protein